MGQVSLHPHPDKVVLLNFQNADHTLFSSPLVFSQSAPGKDSQAIPDEQQRGGIFGEGQNKGSESGQAGDSNSASGNLDEVRILFRPLYYARDSC